MKRTLVIMLTSFALVGCIGNSASSPKLELNVESINFCGRTVDEPIVWNNLQLRNTGKGTLTISALSIRGDEGCAFSCAYPDPGGTNTLVDCPNEGSPPRPFTVEGGATLLVRVGYTPTEVGTADTAALIIESDALNLIENDAKTAVTEIAMCGFGIEGNGMGDTDTADPDAGVSMDGGPSETACPACGEIPKKDAPSCADRR